MEYERFPIFQNTPQRTILDVRINTVVPVLLDGKESCGRAELEWDETTGILYATAYIDDEVVRTKNLASFKYEGKLVPAADIAFSEPVTEVIIDGINYVSADWIALMTVYSTEIVIPTPEPQAV